mmetsp:Transcript_18883/g.18197  ORF Transcript_18883/g.18197 Transcript_18883/m.18197 type:complete len:517 (+) Transcript_18883:283-1833(+)|eukprot:CAMPEP_0119050374 /NCGR_PEP_ID=MMETSP1177-20130426/69574_1 /TAXON_ID=2985 /ORGANISM="Ochromonas sp, Strain CCMP1899" /LENGTH=516 /DNA_ID=CAMNT_0007028693 /DNA_START=242 /DNA_END=1792 /DNA_ORIENTATION=-
MSSTDLKKRLLKIIIVGSTEVGKSCLMERYNDLDFEESYVPTFGDFFVKEIELDDTAVSAKIWDLGSTLALGTTFLRGTHGVILVADITSKKSFKALDSIYESVKRLVGFADDSFPCVVVLNKLDLISDSNVTNSNQTTVECQSNLRQISKADVQQWSKDRRSYGEDPITFYEVSAKDGTNVNLMFKSIIRLALSTNIQMSVNPSASIKASTVSTTTSNSYYGSSEYSVEEKKEIKIEKSLTGKDNGIDKEADYSYQPNRVEVEEEATAKVIIAGAEAVGKSFILTRFVGDDKDHNKQKYEPTVGADLRIADMTVKDRSLTLRIWDTSGSPKMFSIGKSIYKDADCLILVYDITSKSSFLALESYWESYLALAQPLEPEKFPVLLVGNKCDLSHSRAVPLEDVVNWCAKKRPRKPFTYMECSALCSIGVDYIFEFVADNIYDYAIAVDNLSDTDNDNDDNLSDPSSETDTNSCLFPESSIDKNKLSANKPPVPPQRGDQPQEKTCWNPMCLIYGAY